MKNPTFLETNDRPTPDDFDRDGKSDIAFRRPSKGIYFVVRSSDDSCFSFP